MGPGQPIGLGLYKDGASKGATIGFITATPQTGVDSILVTASFLGWPFAVYKVVAALVTGLLGGWLTDAATSSEGPAAESAATTRSVRPTPAQAVAHGVDLLRMIWRWVVFGVLVSALITTFVPPGTLAFGSTTGVVGAYVGVMLVAVQCSFLCGNTRINLM